MLWFITMYFVALFSNSSSVPPLSKSSFENINDFQTSELVKANNEIVGSE